MQAPHAPMPQPYLVPVSLAESRMTHRSGVSGSPSKSNGWPFSMKRIVCLPVAHRPFVIRRMTAMA
ncbi:hypothetical protein [Burkholderia cenocepacia]|uniref:hypothetical protein n=1 Tax=Burkholderia cenocepacia TaxID=95486 RepID=UPI001FC8D621|nr:hypothetical protein [Burkholderia cenocepacia]USB87952.1 hypothetical protein NBG98_18935 [Burkholderia cenocepacia]